MTALLVLAAPAARAAGLSPNLSIHTTAVNTTTLAPGRTYNGYPSYKPPPAAYGGPRPPRGTTSFSSNSQFDDSTGNLNPGGGGSGTPTVKELNLQ
ncbi:hypothetical protein [Bradyrhizobium iriomotense]|uniref:Uncharacterized protein n=1 Tax=Bradyrhizobium iriomotense TaxID=441950 RepID=A0ABQ6AWM8_9BRAD|nr:hypothetical protein [Bradyrhizobium iriomotense]GLR84546.1 hypothetical protein GCM10007857_12560 [Bradyrhizobium iriomotense]